MSLIKFYLKRLWTREKPDGKKGWGALRYLLAGVILMVLGLWSIHRMVITGSAGRAKEMMGGADAPVNPAAGQVRLGEVAKAAQSTSPIELKAKKRDSLADSEVGMSLNTDANGDRSTAEGESKPSAVESFFGDSPKPKASAPVGTAGGYNPADDPNNSIFEALSRSDQAPANDGRPTIDDEGNPLATKPGSKGAPARGSSKPGVTSEEAASNNSGFAPPTVGGPQATRDGEPKVPSIESLVVKDTGVPASKVDSMAQAEGKTVAPSRFLPGGEIIPVYLMQTVQTGKFPTFIEFAVAKTVWMNGEPVLPFGTRFTATAGLGVRDRITFHVDSLRRRDGLVIAVSGIILGTDKSTGLQAYYMAPPDMAQLAPYIGSFANAFGALYAQRATATSLSVGGVSLSSQPTVASGTEDAAISSMSQAMSSFISSQLTEIHDRYASYLTAPEGSACYVQLMSNTDFTALWDKAKEGEMLTVGAPNVVSTESVYQLASDRSREQSLSSLVAQAAVQQASQALPANPVTQGVAAVAKQIAPTPTPGPAAPPVQSPFDGP